MSEQEDELVDLPDRKSIEEVPDWIRQKNEQARGYGFNPQNARKIIAGGPQQQAEYDPSEDDINAARKFFSYLWDMFQEQRKNRPAMRKKYEGDQPHYARGTKRAGAEGIEHGGDEMMDYASMQREPE